MRVTRAKAAETRGRIVEAAARLFRQRGLDGVGIDALTAAAGLTHGGFYRHFASKDDLAAEALAKGLSAEAAPAGMPADRDGYLIWYLSARHRDDPGHGCVMAALGCDAARGGPGVRRSFTQAVAAQVGRFTRWSAAAGVPDPRARAIADVSAMVGAMMLARAVDDPALSDEILAAVRARLSDPD